MFARDERFTEFHLSYVRFAVNCDQSNIAVKRGKIKFRLTFIRKGKKREKRKEQKTEVSRQRV